MALGKYSKWIGGGLGWAFFGPIGGILGFALGSMFQDMDTGKYEHQAQRPGSKNQQNGTPGDFGVALLVLAGAVMKADGRLLKSELNFIRQFFEAQFGPNDTKGKMLLFREILKQEYSLRQVSIQIRQNLDHSSRIQLVHFLYGIANADGHIHPAEISVIERIAGYLYVNDKDLGSIKAMFIQDTDSAYKILEVSPSVSDAELKKAYRKMAVKYHPDKVSHLGEEFQQSAKEKFQKVQEAWEQLKKERGI